MIVFINYLLPIAGLSMCVYVIFTRKINTRASVCAAKLNLWVVIWLMLLWADWASGFVLSSATVFARSITFTINVLDVKQLTVSRKPRVRVTAGKTTHLKKE